MDFTPALRNEYRDLFASCVVNASRVGLVDSIVDRIAQNKQRYAAAGKPFGVPWHVIGIINTLEGGGGFTTHLHNGDPLTARTVHVPAGRPPHGQPPFTWEESAADAIVFEGLNRWKDWSVPGMLFLLEGFNGYGYHGRGINSPYLWSFSNHYTKGKFVKDGVFSPTAVSEQCGAAVMLSRMVARRLTKVTGVTPGPAPVIPHPDDGILRQGDKGPAVKQVKVLLKRWFDATSPGEWATLKVAPNAVFGAGLVKAVRIFQARVNIEVDGKVGDETMGALRAKPKPPGTAKTPDLTFQAGLKRGSTGLKVRLVQGWLNLHDCNVPCTGTFGPATEAALEAFQRQAGLPATGIVDQKTWNALVAPMVAALTPITGIPQLPKLIVAYAQQHLKQHPREAGGDNRGPWVRLYTNGVEGAGAPWCAGFDTFIVQQACQTLGVPMPIRRTLLCDDMGASAGNKFVKGGTAAAIARLKPGSFFLLRDKPGATFKYKHCGIIVSADPEHMTTIEGNTNHDGSSNGTDVEQHVRDYTGADFIVL